MEKPDKREKEQSFQTTPLHMNVHLRYEYSNWVYATKKMPVRDRSTKPQKVGSEAEASCPRLQGHSRSKRDFLRKGGMTKRYEKSPAIWLGILNGAQSIPTWVYATKKIPAENENSGFRRYSFSFLQHDFLIFLFEYPIL